MLYEGEKQKARTVEKTQHEPDSRRRKEKREKAK